MDEWKLPWEGGCLCGRTRFRISKPPLLTVACHCLGCQRLTASAFSLSFGVPTDGFEITQGEPVLGGINKNIQHFCPDCLSWIFTRAPMLGDQVIVRATMLDEHGWFEPYAEFYTSEKLGWVTTPARRAFEKFPALEEFDGLIAAFSEEGVGPG